MRMKLHIIFYFGFFKSNWEIFKKEEEAQHLKGEINVYQRNYVCLHFKKCLILTGKLTGIRGSFRMAKVILKYNFLIRKMSSY